MTDTNQYLLTKDIIDMNIPFHLSSYFYRFLLLYKFCSPFCIVNLRSWLVYHAAWRIIGTKRDDFRKTIVWDRRGRCFQWRGFEKIVSVPESLLANISAPLLFCSKMALHAVEESINFSGAFISVCPFQKCFKGTLISSTDSIMKNFITFAILSAVIKYRSKVEQENRVTKNHQCNWGFGKLHHFPSKPTQV